MLPVEVKQIQNLIVQTARGAQWAEKGLEIYWDRTGLGAGGSSDLAGHRKR